MNKIVLKCNFPQPPTLYEEIAPWPEKSIPRMSAAFLVLSGLHGLLYKAITIYSSALPETFKSVDRHV